MTPVRRQHVCVKTGGSRVTGCFLFLFIQRRKKEKKSSAPLPRSLFTNWELKK